MLYEKVAQALLVCLSSASHPFVVHLLDLVPTEPRQMERQRVVVLDALRGNIQLAFDLLVRVVRRAAGFRAFREHNQNRIGDIRLNRPAKLVGVPELNGIESRLDALISENSLKM